MFKLVVLSVFVAVIVAKPQLHHSAIAYSAPNLGHSATFLTRSGPGSAISSSASSSLLNDGGFLSNSAQAVAGPSVIAYGAPVYRAYTPAVPVVSAFSTQSYASSQGGNRYSTPAVYQARSQPHDAHNGREAHRVDARPVNNQNTRY